jgi:tetratricopeptide (TPR) repeat protein
VAPEATAAAVSDAPSDVIPGPAEFAESDLLQAAAEGGVLGIAAVLGVLLSIPIFLWRRLRRSQEGAVRQDMVLLCATAVAFLIQSALLSPMHLAASGMVLVVVVGLAASTAYGEQVWRSLHLKGWRTIAAGGISLVIAAAGAVLAVQSLAATSHLQASQAALDRGELSAAAEALSRSIAADPCPREAYFLRATVSLFAAEQAAGSGGFGDAAEHFEDAREDLEICRVRFPHPEVYLSLANLGLVLEDPPTIRTGVEWLLQYAWTPDLKVQALYLDGLLAKREGDRARAMAVLSEAIRDYPDYVRSYIALADLEVAQGRGDEARLLYEQALTLAEAKLADAESRLGDPSGLTAGERSAWQRTRSEAQQEIDVARRALAAFEVPEP